MAIKKSDKNRDAKKRDLEEHVVAEADLVDNARQISDDATQWKATQGEVHSDTKLEDDKGEGAGVIIRSFDFQANPEAFHERTPSKQELFNAHAKQIEYFLYKDGFEVMYDSVPRLQLSKNRKFYRISVAATPRKGWLMTDKPKTLTELINEPTRTD